MPLLRFSLKIAAASEDPQRAAGVFADEDAVLAVDVGVDVDRAALVGRFLDEAVGAEGASGGKHAPWAVFGLGECADVVGAFAAVAGADLCEVAGGAGGDEVEHAADGAVDRRDRWRLRGRVRPIGWPARAAPPSESSRRMASLRGTSSSSDEGAAGGSRAKSADADALRRGIGDERTGAAEELYAGKLAELVVHGDCSCGAKRGRREDACGDRAFNSPSGSTIGGDGDLLGFAGGVEPDGDWRNEFDGLARESVGLDANGAGVVALNGEVAIGVGAAKERPEESAMVAPEIAAPWLSSTVTAIGRGV